MDEKKTLEMEREWIIEEISRIILGGYTKSTQDEWLCEIYTLCDALHENEADMRELGKDEL